MVHSKHRPDIELADSEMAKRTFATDICRLLNGSSVVIDVGANRGQFASSLLEITDVGRIYSFEPVPAAFSALEKLSLNDPRVHPIQLAISTKTEKLPFFLTESDVGSSLLRPIRDQPSKWLSVEAEIFVDSIRLDEFIHKNLNPESGSIDLLKSDAQGADKDVLLSAGIYLQPNFIKAVLVEVSFTSFYENQDGYSEVVSLLDQKGYRPARIYPHRAHDDWLWWADILFIGK